MDIDTAGWLILGLSALIVGLCKTSIGALGALAVAGFAWVLPAKESTAAVLLALICGDIVAVAIYRRQADWAELKKLLPAVVPGILLGTVFMRLVSDQVMLLAVAGCLLVGVGLQIGLNLARRPVPVAGAGQATADRPAVTPGVAPGVRAGLRAHLPAVAAGVAAGFTTMVANAAGAVMSLYLLAIRADKMRFVATGAWFFLLVNLAKVPFSAGLGLIHPDTLLLLAVLIPPVLIGTWLGRRFLRRLSQQWFERLTIAASAIAAFTLLVKGLW
jgi:uncharacterized membrane protein YfcA